MEVLVALLIISTSLLLLLAAIRQGLFRLEICRSEFESCLSMETAVSAFSNEGSLPSGDTDWTSEESEPRPGLKFVLLRQDNGTMVWTSKLEPENQSEEQPVAE
jgi:hypothetical protein